MSCSGDELWQGDILSLSAVTALNITLSENERAVVITHDCDLNSPSDTHIEILVGSIEPKANRTFTGAHNPRKLHLTYQVNGAPLILQLSYTQRHTVAKADIDGVHEKRLIESQLPEKEKRALKQWLAARYGRPAFPNNFETRLRKGKGGKELTDKIDALLSAISEYIVGVFFDLDSDRTKELPVGEPYCLKVFIVYETYKQTFDSRQKSTDAAVELKKLFDLYFGEDSGELIVDRVAAIADTQFTLSQIRRADQWRVDYISFQQGDDACLAIGDTPA